MRPIRYALELAVGVVVAALVMRTWVAMGLVVPVLVSGSSMAPTLRGPCRVFRCPACGNEIAVGLAELPSGPRAFCPTCGARASAIREIEARRGDRLVVDRTAFAWHGPRRWEVVVFRCPEQADELCVKRVVGLPGECVSFAHGEVLINERLERKPIPQLQGVYYEARAGDRPTHGHDSQPAGNPPTASWQLGPGQYFVVGDNAATSYDSRNWLAGPGLDAKLLVGKPLGVR